MQSEEFPPLHLCYSQAVDDESQENKDVVALEIFDITHKPFAQFPEIPGLPKTPLVQKVGPGTDGGFSLLQPFLGRALGQKSWDGDPEGGQEAL